MNQIIKDLIERRNKRIEEMKKRMKEEGYEQDFIDRFVGEPMNIRQMVEKDIL